MIRAMPSPIEKIDKVRSWAKPAWSGWSGSSRYRVERDDVTYRDLTEELWVRVSLRRGGRNYEKIHRRPFKPTRYDDLTGRGAIDRMVREAIDEALIDLLFNRLDQRG